MTIDKPRIGTVIGNGYRIVATAEFPPVTPEYCKRFIKRYQEKLERTDPKLTPDEYARTQRDIGTHYQQLGYFLDSEEYFELSISAFEEALKIYAPDYCREYYLLVMKKLGDSCYVLGLSNYYPEIFLKKAIFAYQEVSKFATIRNGRFGFDYGYSQMLLAGCYLYLAYLSDPTDCSKKAITAYENALEVFKPDKFPREYIKIKYNTGICYSYLALYENKTLNCNEALLAIDEALKLFPKDENPEVFADLQKGRERIRTLCRDLHTRSSFSA
jgi:tetratricopeptide (TPR) repeat protein